MKTSTVRRSRPFSLRRTPSKPSTATTIRPFASKHFSAAINSFLKCEKRSYFGPWTKAAFTPDAARRASSIVKLEFHGTHTDTDTDIRDANVYMIAYRVQYTCTRAHP